MKPEIEILPTNEPLVTKEDAVSRLCSLSTKVMEEVFDYSEAADCFCGGNSWNAHPPSYRMSEHVIAFIEEAVAEKIERES